MSENVRKAPTSTFMPIADPSRLWGHKAEDIEYLRGNIRRVLVDIMRIFIANRTAPVTLWGPPGSRKTRTIEALVHEKDENGVPYQVITVQPSTEDPTVIHGMMYTSLDSESGETIMKRSIPDIAQQVVNYFDECGGLTVLFLDEMTTCMPAQQHALLGILTHGKYGDINIQPYISVVMAANPENTVSTVHPLGEQVINRGGHIAWYGDMNLFLEEWRTGFNGAVTSPDALSDWYMTTLMMEAPDKVFRNDRGSWKPDNLVPYELIENSERSMTEHSKLVTLVNELFKDSPDKIRHFYLGEVTKAILGMEWANRMAIVCAKEKDRVSGEFIIEQVREKGVTFDWDIDRVKGVFDTILYMSPTGVRMRQDQVQSVAMEISEASRKEYDPIAAMALWVFAATAPDEGTRAGLHLHMVSVLLSGFNALKAGLAQKEQVVTPNFIDDKTKENLRAAVRR